MEKEKIKAIIEAILFACGREVEIKELMSALEMSSKDIISVIEEMKQDYEKENRGIQIIKVNSAFQLTTKKEYYEYIYPIFDKRNKPNLSNAALETLSIIAYNPKITKSEIETIRGVNSDFAVNRLLECGLVEEVARLNLPGRPAAYSVTNEFLKSCNIEDVSCLPKFDEIRIKDEQMLISDFEKDDQTKA